MYVQFSDSFAKAASIVCARGEKTGVEFYCSSSPINRFRKRYNENRALFIEMKQSVW